MPRSTTARRAAFGEPWLLSEHGLTAAVTLPKGAVEVDEPAYTLRPGVTPSPLAVLGLAAAAVMILCMATYRVHTRVASARDFASELPPTLSPGLAGLVVSRNTLRSELLLAMIVHLEERGVISSEPNPRWPGDWLFTLRAAPNGPAVSTAEQELLRLMFRTAETTDLNQLARQIDPPSAQRIRNMLAREGDRFGLWAPRRRALTVLLVVACLAGAGLSALLGLEETVEGSTLIAISLLATALAAAALLGLSNLSRYGRHVRELLVTARKDTRNGGPRSMAGYPAWAIALGVRNGATAHASQLLAHQHRGYRGDPYHRRPYYHDDHYCDRWEETLRPRTHPQSSSSGGSGSFGGGSVGGGGGRR